MICTKHFSVYCSHTGYSTAASSVHEPGLCQEAACTLARCCCSRRRPPGLGGLRSPAAAEMLGSRGTADTEAEDAEDAGDSSV